MTRISKYPFIAAGLLAAALTSAALAQQQPSAADRYARTLAEAEITARYNTQIEQQLRSQQTEIAALDRQLETERERLARLESERQQEVVRLDQARVGDGEGDPVVAARRHVGKAAVADREARVVDRCGGRDGFRVEVDGEPLGLRDFLLLPAGSTPCLVSDEGAQVFVREAEGRAELIVLGAQARLDDAQREAQRSRRGRVGRLPGSRRRWSRSRSKNKP